jgi:von Willebrand factor A domain-containing protein 8
LKDWLSDEHANMFFTIPSQPMGAQEESAVLSATGCPQHYVDTLLTFAEKYRSSMSADNVLKNRKLGTRSLVRIARRLALCPWDNDIYYIIQRSLLAEFLPATEKMNLNAILKDSNIFKQTSQVRCLLTVLLTLRSIPLNS